jgi:hypothetical protein
LIYKCKAPKDFGNYFESSILGLRQEGDYYKDKKEVFENFIMKFAKTVGLLYYETGSHLENECEYI